MATHYEVIGLATVLGHRPGEKFHADLEPAHEARMLKGRFLAIVEKPAKAKTPKADDVDGDTEEGGVTDG
jgi:hypothetical protein